MFSATIRSVGELFGDIWFMFRELNQSLWPIVSAGFGVVEHEVTANALIAVTIKVESLVIAVEFKSYVSDAVGRVFIVVCLYVVMYS